MLKSMYRSWKSSDVKIRQGRYRHYVEITVMLQYRSACNVGITCGLLRIDTCQPLKKKYYGVDMAAVQPGRTGDATRCHLL